MNRLLTALLLLAPFAVQAADHTVEHRTTVVVDAGTTYSFANLVGEITVVGHDGDGIVIEATVTAESAELAEAVRIAVDGDELWMTFPVDEHRDYRYRPRDGGNMNTNTSYRGERVRVSSRGDGIEVSAVVRISMPRGAMMDVSQSVGTLSAQGTDGMLSLRSGSGRIETTATRGELQLRSGSGSVEAEGHAGPADLRTGSGRVRASAIDGDLAARTGSGSVRVDGVRGDVEVRTGSGSVDVRDIAEATSVDVTTGSGSVEIGGDLAGVTDMEVRTGSGGVDIDATGVPNVRLDAHAGSGSVRVNVTGMQDVITERNRIRATLGDGSGEAAVRTGSGSIRIEIR